MERERGSGRLQRLWRGALEYPSVLNVLGLAAIMGVYLVGSAWLGRGAAEQLLGAVCVFAGGGFMLWIYRAAHAQTYALRASEGGESYPRARSRRRNWRR